MKFYQFIFFSSFTLFQSAVAQSSSFENDSNVSSLGELIDQKNDSKHRRFTIKTKRSKIEAPMRGAVSYVGELKGYGLSVVLKDAHSISIIGKLDRATVLKGQYVMAGDKLGTAAVSSEVIYVIQPLPKINHNTGTVEKVLSNEDLIDLLKEIGFPEESIPTMVCIAKLESGLNPSALNYNHNKSVDVGLFQINSSWFKKCDTNLAALYDEKENSRCALTVLKHQGFPAWTAYNKMKNSPNFCD